MSAEPVKGLSVAYRCLVAQPARSCLKGVDGVLFVWGVCSGSVQGNNINIWGVWRGMVGLRGGGRTAIVRAG